MKIIFHPRAWENYCHWQQSDRQLLKRVNELVKAIQRQPFEGIGKPEPLRFELSGCWSRRINEEHRISIGNDVVCKLTAFYTCSSC
jgi:toxin YoeB